MKAHIFEAVPRKDVRDRVPAEFREFVNQAALNEPTYTVVLFPGKRGQSTTIVDSRLLTEALAGLSKTAQPIVAVGEAFTEEAQRALGEIGALCFYASDFYWSDASCARIRNK